MAMATGFCPRDNSGTSPTPYHGYFGAVDEDLVADQMKAEIMCIKDHENAAEFLADLISTDYSSPESVQSPQKRIENLIDEFTNKDLITEFNSPVTQLEGSGFSTKHAQKTTRKQKRGWWRQFRLLFKRAWMQMYWTQYSIA